MVALHFSTFAITICSAVSPSDYILSMSNVGLEFVVGQTRVCYFIYIVHDDICENEPNEFFYSNLVVVGGKGPIFVFRSQTEINIDDTSEPECGKLLLYYTVIVFNATCSHCNKTLLRCVSPHICAVPGVVLPLSVYLMNGSPRLTVNSRSIEAEFETTRPVAGVRCFLRSRYSRVWRNCKSCHITNVFLY